MTKCQWEARNAKLRILPFPGVEYSHWGGRYPAQMIIEKRPDKKWLLRSAALQIGGILLKARQVDKAKQEAIVIVRKKLADEIKILQKMLECLP